MSKTLLSAIAILSFFSPSQAEEIIRPAIVGGENSDPNAYPWMVALVRFDRDSVEEGHFCGGILIHPKWILTAAHCVDDYDSGAFEIAVSDGDLTANVDLYRSDGVFIHPEADILRVSRSCDIALIRLAEPILDVEPVQLERAASALSVGRRVKSIGWGATNYVSETDSTSSILKEVESVITEIGDDEAHAPIHDYFVSTEGTDPIRGTYSGDSGGPLLVKNFEDEEWVVAGITSFGRRDTPNNYNINFSTKISYTAPWIDSYVSHPLSKRPEIGMLDRIETGIIQNGEPKVGYRFWPFADGPAVSIKRAGTYAIAGLPSFQLNDTRHIYNEDGSFTFLDTGFSLKGRRTATSLMQITQESKASYGNAPLPIVPFQYATGDSPNSRDLTMGKWGQTFLLEGLQAEKPYTYPVPHKLYAVSDGRIQAVHYDWISGQNPHPYKFTAKPDTLYLLHANEFSASPSSFIVGILPFDAVKLGRGQTISGTLSSASHPYRGKFTRAELLELQGDPSDEFRLELHSDFDAEIQLIDKGTAQKIGYYDIASEGETETFIFSGNDFQNGCLAILNFDKDIFGDFTATLTRNTDPNLEFGVEKQYAVTNADESFPHPDSGKSIFYQYFEVTARPNKDHMKVKVHTAYADLGIAVYSNRDLVEFEYGDTRTKIEFPTEPGQEFEIYAYDFDGFQNVNFDIEITDSEGPTLSAESKESSPPASKYKKQETYRPSNSARSDKRERQRLLDAHLTHRSGQDEN